jgi:hypothetical protein
VVGYFEPAEGGGIVTGEDRIEDLLHVIPPRDGRVSGIYR